HYWDAFHYYVGGKYFRENHYERIYQCSAIAEVDDGRAEEFADRQIRDLRDNSLGPAKPVLDRPEAYRAAFTPDRWAEFRQDLRLFRSYMGQSWWEKMFKDHGFNASPVWIMVGRTITNINGDALVPPAELANAPSNVKGRRPSQLRAVRDRFEADRVAFESRMGVFALLDFLLYAGIFAFILWAFGLRACALAVLIWGCGYPWAYFWTGGSFGRVPWLFAAVAGVSLLKRGYSALGGAGITWSMLLRVFPGALIGGVAAKIGWSLLVALRQRQGVDRWRAATELLGSVALIGLGALWLERGWLSPEVADGGQTTRGVIALTIGLAALNFVLLRRGLASKAHARLVLGCTLALGGLVLASLPVVGGTHAYREFIGNSLKHKQTPLTNHMGLPTIFSRRFEDRARATRDNKLDDPFLVWKQKRQANLEARRPFWLGTVALFLLALGYVGRRTEDWEVTAMSTLLIVGLFELTCYYYNFTILLAPLVLARERRWMQIAGVVLLLGMCIAGMWMQLLIGWYDEQYFGETWVVLGVMLVILAGLIYEVATADRAERAERLKASASPT
ncbi:MAG: hypothetical protein KC620_14970, partial [Myxococcales bacterium]|nr:hypothetical protein [Myxococcales bacterium]